MEVYLPVLLAEDEPTDAELMRYAFNRACVKNPVIVVPDGQEALYYLRGNGKFGQRENFPRPCLLITDIKMPKVDGFDLLETAAAEKLLDNIPALVLSTSFEERDIQRAGQLGAAHYYVKPAGIDGLVALAKEIDHKWLARHCRTKGKPFAIPHWSTAALDGPSALNAP